MRLGRIIITELNAQNTYYKNGRKEIADENLTVMMIAGSFGFCTALLFFIIAPLMIPMWKVTKEYLSILPTLLGGFLFAFLYKRRDHDPNPLVVEVACIVFYILLLGSFIALSSFPYPNTPQIFVSLCFMFMPTLLILRPWELIIIMLGSEAVFLLLIFQYKTQFSIENDIFNTFASLLFSFIIMIVINRLRYRNYSARIKLQKISQTDVLTGLLNKSSFEESCADKLAAQSLNEYSALIILDLDNFKIVNDQYGHPFGDQLLAACGTALRHSFRQTDLTGRVGGDEFAVFMPEIHDRSIINRKCELIKEAFENIKVEEQQIKASCSIGVAVSSPSHLINYAELFRAADKLLYQVKRSGKDSFNIKYL